MTGRLDFLSNVRTISPYFIGLPNGLYTVANSEGTVHLGPKLVIHNVYISLILCVI